MKKIVLIILSAIMTFSMCSCVSLRSIQLTSLMSKEEKLINKKSNEIIDCLTTKDRVGFESLFCEKVRSDENFKKQTDELFSFFQCDTYIRSQIDTVAGGGDSIEGGVKKEWYVIPNIIYINTHVNDSTSEDGLSDRFFGVSYYWVIKDVDNPALEGLHYMTISLLNSEKSVMAGSEEYIIG